MSYKSESIFMLFLSLLFFSFFAFDLRIISLWTWLFLILSNVLLLLSFRLLIKHDTNYAIHNFSRHKWISIDDSLPDTDIPVCVHDGYNVFLAVRVDTDEGWIWANAHNTLYPNATRWLDAYDITHWMTLPHIDTVS